MTRKDQEPILHDGHATRPRKGRQRNLDHMVQEPGPGRAAEYCWVGGQEHP